MRVQECVTENRVVSSATADAATWGRIIVEPVVKDQLLNQALMALTLRPKVGFVATALHGLITLFGPPGTGKTTMAAGLPFELSPYVAGGHVRRIQINPHGLMSAEHGQSQQRVYELLSEHLPSLADDGVPTVVILDEVESMAVARSQASLAANPADVHRATDAVLTALDSNAREHPHMLWIATSNFTSALDQAFLSRSDVAIEVPLPSAEAIRRILADTLDALAFEYPALGEMARSEDLLAVATAAVGIDGRQARKAVFEAIACKLSSVIDPGLLSIEALAKVVTNFGVSGASA